MKTKIFLITLVPIVTLYFILCQNFDNGDDISNIPHSQVPGFKKIEKSFEFGSLIEKHSKNDYSKLIDIDFTFKSKPDVCRYHKPFLLILVHSSLENTKKRKVIRETWGRKRDGIILLFLVGSSNNTVTKKKIWEESSTFSDLIIGSFLDTYKNLTYKHVMGFKYALYHCTEATYILKTDDDIFVNTPYLLQYLKSNVSQYGAEKLLMCNVWRRATVARSYRSKYRFSFRDLPFKTFPTYCSGWFILYSPDVVHDLYAQAQLSQYFWVDDVFVTGVLAGRLNIPHFNLRNLVITKERMDNIANGFCDITQGNFLLGRPNIHGGVIRQLWTCALLSSNGVQ